MTDSDNVQTSGGYPPPGMGSTLNMPYEFKCSRCGRVTLCGQPFKDHCPHCGGTLVLHPGLGQDTLSCTGCGKYGQTHGDQFCDECKAKLLKALSEPPTCITAAEARQIAMEVIRDLMPQIREAAREEDDKLIAEWNSELETRKQETIEFTKRSLTEMYAEIAADYREEFRTIAREIAGDYDRVLLSRIDSLEGWRDGWSEGFHSTIRELAREEILKLTPSPQILDQQIREEAARLWDERAKVTAINVTKVVSPPFQPTVDEDDELVDDSELSNLLDCRGILKDKPQPVADGGEASSEWETSEATETEFAEQWTLRHEGSGYTVIDNNGSVRGHYRDATIMGVHFGFALQDRDKLNVDIAALRQQLADATGKLIRLDATEADNQRLQAELRESENLNSHYRVAVERLEADNLRQHNLRRESDVGIKRLRAEVEGYRNADEAETNRLRAEVAELKETNERLERRLQEAHDWHKEWMEMKEQLVARRNLTPEQLERATRLIERMQMRPLTPLIEDCQNLLKELLGG